MAEGLWLINLVLAAATVVMLRNVLSLRVRLSRQERLRFLEEAVLYLDDLPSPDAMVDAWQTILSRSVNATRPDDAMISAIYALEHSYDAVVEALRDAVKPQVNLINKFGELADEGLVRPMDIVRLHPDIHIRLLKHLAIIAPFIWYEAILSGRGRWGYRPLRLKAVFENLRPASPRESIRSPLVLEVEGHFFLALPSVTALERAWAYFRLSIRSPTITVRSKVAQIAKRHAIEAQLREAGFTLSRTAGPTGAVEW
ncbi:MAG TPA: hypothetical protein VGM14_12495 [Streptosporangiaceae bacterium]|jgi:hypothetical protein